MEDVISSFFQEDAEIITSSPNKNCNTTYQTTSYNSDLSQNSTISDSDSLSLSQLTLDEVEPLDIKPYFNISPRKMPQSPHNIVEETFSSNPWAMLIATIFLTKTSYKCAHPYMRDFFKEYPTPYHVLNDNPYSLERFFDNLGLRKRGCMIWKLSYQFISSKWRRVSDLCGIGKYGEDAFRIFCLGHTDLEPSDRYLRLYLDWLKGCTEFLEENGEVDCEYFVKDPILKYYKITLRNAD